MMTDAPTFEDVEVSVLPFLLENNSRNPAFTYKEPIFRWAISETIGGVDGQPSIPYKTLESGTFPANTSFLDFPSVEIHVPANTSFMMVNGTIGPDLGGLDATLKTGPGGWNSTIVRSGPSRVNLSSPYVAPAMIWYTALDPALRYNLTLAPYNIRNSSISLHSVTFYSGLW
ncbi:hypothetical protein Q8F55_003104 [Vanrija albida]|uniref:Uncharacterized protein n=1 Tax=Vanrija albida TaxID=181172 RepID=A0ABR3QBL2_9TREE